MDSNNVQKASDGDVLHIDLDAILRSRLGGWYRIVPRPLVKWLAGVICQDEMNEMLERCHGLRDAAFSRQVLQHLDVKVDVFGSENLPAPSHRRVTIVSNHPLGGLDGMALIEWATSHWGEGVKFVVNDLLMAIQPLSGTFVPINKHGAQSRDASRLVDEVMASDNPVIVFPAGLVSRMGPDGTVKDLAWQKMFVNKSSRYGRDVLPVYFDGHNSEFFYKFARWRSRLGLRFNIEMVRLPRELFLNRGARLAIHVGQLVPWEQLRSGREASSQATQIKEIVYSLK